MEKVAVTDQKIRDLIIAACRLPPDAIWRDGPHETKIRVDRKDLPILEFVYRDAGGEHSVVFDASALFPVQERKVN